MKKWKSGCFIVMLFAVLFISTVSAQAALELRGTDNQGNRLIYDSDLNITWYDYTNSYDYWSNQTAWASSLSVTFGGAVYDDWRLPSTVDGPWSWGYDGSTTAGYNITSSEMGHLFYTGLGNKGYCSTSGSCPQSGWGLTNTGEFQHLLVGHYWSGTQVSASPDDAWYFNTYEGRQTGNYKVYGIYALAVRDGDVPQQPIAPEPISSNLFITGGALLAGRRFIRRKA